MVIIAIAAARSFAVKRSPIVPAESATGAAPAKPARNRKPIKEPTVGENAHPRLNARRKRLLMWYTHKRPYISDIGARTRGCEMIRKYFDWALTELTERAKERRNMTSVRAIVVGSVSPYFIAISGSPGAIIELANGAMKVYNDTCFVVRQIEVKF
jgi:hypothetical protein